MPQPAVLYARFSSAEQALGYSLDRQITNGKRFVTERGWQVEAVITDEGKSAFHGVNRSAGSSLFEFEAEACEGRHRGKVLCVENVDRLSRQGSKEAIQLIWKLNENGVDIATWHDGKVYRAGARSELIDVFTILMGGERAYQESAVKSQRSRDSWQKRYADIAAGMEAKTSRVPAWVIRAEHGYVLHGQRTDLLNEIYDRYIAGQGIISIVQTLNSRDEPGWAVRRDKKTKALLPDKGWYQAYVYRLLTHRSVLGEYVTTDRRSLAPDFFPQAVTAEKFNRAQEVRGTKKVDQRHGGSKINNLLTGMVICNSCGGSAAFENKGANASATYTTKAGVKRFYKGKRCVRLSCDNRRRGKGCTNAERFDYHLVETAILDALGDYLDYDSSDPKLDRMREEISEVERQISIAEQRLNNLIDVIADGGSKALAARIAGLEEEIATGRKRADDLKRPLFQRETLPDALADINLLATLRLQLNNDDPALRYAARHQTNMALKRLVDSITITEHGDFALVTRWAFWEFDKAGNVTLEQDF